MALSIRRKYEGINVAYKAVSIALRLGRWTSLLRGPLLELQGSISKARYNVESQIGLTRLSASAANREFHGLLKDFYSELLVFQSTLKYGAELLERGEEAKFHFNGLDQIEKSATELKALRDKIYLITPRFGFNSHVSQLILDYELGTFCRRVKADRAALYLDNSQRIYRTYYFWGFSPQESMHFIRNESEINQAIMADRTTPELPRALVDLKIRGAHVIEWLPFYRDVYHGIKLYFFRDDSDFSKTERGTITMLTFAEEGKGEEQFYVPILDYLTDEFKATAVLMKHGRHSSAVDEASRTFIPDALEMRGSMTGPGFIERAQKKIESLLADLPTAEANTKTWVKIFSKKGIKPASTDVVRLVGEIGGKYGKKIEGRRLKFNMDIGPGPALCICDREYLTDAINNLLENAIKYNRPDGTITLRVFRSGKNN